MARARLQNAPRGERFVDSPEPVRKPILATEETRLIEEAQRGDVNAFEKIYRSYSGRVYAICIRLSGNPGKAEDLTQDVFLRVWQRLDTFKGQSAFSSWLYRLTVNIAIDRIRWEQRRTKLEIGDEKLESIPAPERQSSPETRMSLDAAIATLPHGARVAFVLHDIEGYKHEEIAEMTGLAVGTSKAQLHRARKLLRRVLE